jgi:hypothetical protein
MARTGRGAIDVVEATYLELQLVGNDPTARKNALQRLCRLYRIGQRLRSPERTVLLVLGLLYDADKKVVRWALNASAFLIRGDRINAILDAIDRNREDPDILGAGVAALAATHDHDRLRELLEEKGLPLQGATLLAAAQKLPALGANLVANRVDIDSAPIPDLRLASVLVGIEKAPENMFDADYPNSEVIGQLNSHPDDVVAQYSIWATMENQRLGLAHLRIPLADVMAQRPNVRAYIYRLVANDIGAARANIDFLEAASNDADPEARASLARGLRDTYFDGLEEIIVPWLLEEEPSSAAAGFLLEHMATHSMHMASYAEFVEQAYRLEASGSTARARIEAAAKGSPLATKLGRIRVLSDHGDLLDMGRSDVTNFNFNGPATGAFSGSGNAQTGDISAMYQLQAPQIASETLQKLADLLAEDDHADGNTKIEIVQAAQAPTKGTVQKVLDWFRVAKEGGQLAAATINGAPALIENLQKALPYLPG